MEILEFYTRLLKSNQVVVMDGTDSTLVIEGQNTPITVNQKTLVLPTKFVLDNYNNTKDEIQVFHPVSENVLRQDSDIFNFLKRLYRTSLTIRIEALIRNLVNFVANKELSDKAVKKQREFIKGLTNIDDKSIANLQSFLKRIDPNGDNKIIDFTVQRGDSIDDRAYNRVAYLHHPLHRELVENAAKPYGATLRKKDVQLLNELLETIFGKFLTERDPYPHGSDNRQAPNFVALTELYVQILERFNKIAEAFKGKFEDVEIVDTEWVVGLEDIERYRRVIMTFPGNDGEVTATERVALRETTRQRITPIGTVREVPQEPEEKPAQAMSYEERRKLTLERNPSSGYARRGSRFRSEVDLTGLDENFQREDSRGRGSYRERYDDRRSARDSYRDRYAGDRRQVRYR